MAKKDIIKYQSNADCQAAKNNAKMKNTAILTSGIGLIINGIIISLTIGYAGILTILVGMLVLSYGIISIAKKKE